MNTRKKFLRRLPGYAAMGAAASSAHAAVVFFDSSHAFTITVPPTTVHGDFYNTHDWDIDGNGSTDFHFVAARHFGSSYNHVIMSANPQGIMLNHWVAPAHTSAHYTFQIKPLPHSFSIKATGMASGAVLQLGYLGGIFTQSNLAASPLQSGEQFVGFAFGISGQEHFGWADIVISAQSLTVKKWAYEGLANFAISTPLVPEPADSALGLGLLALGAAGVSAYKRRKKVAA